MKFLINEFPCNGSSQASDVKFFGNIPDVVNHLRKINKAENLKLEQEPLSEARMESLLKDKLSTVTVSKENEQDKRWVVTSF